MTPHAAHFALGYLRLSIDLALRDVERALHGGTEGDLRHTLRRLRHDLRGPSEDRMLTLQSASRRELAATGGGR